VHHAAGGQERLNHHFVLDCHSFYLSPSTVPAMLFSMQDEEERAHNFSDEAKSRCPIIPNLPAVNIYGVRSLQYTRNKIIKA
jgi:hypothetical protein